MIPPPPDPLIGQRLAVLRVVYDRTAEVHRTLRDCAAVLAWVLDGELEDEAPKPSAYPPGWEPRIDLTEDEADAWECTYLHGHSHYCDRRPALAVRRTDGSHDYVGVCDDHWRVFVADPDGFTR